MSLQQLVVQIQGLSSSDGDLDSLNGQLKGLAIENILKSNAGALLEALQALDIYQHSLGFLYLLEAKSRHACNPQGDPAFFQTALRFLIHCNGEQIRRAPLRFCALCTVFRAQAMALNKIKYAVLPLKNAIHALCPNPASISPIHADFFQACLLAKCYSAATVILNADAYLVDPPATGVTATDILLYFYYGGMLETGRRRYDRAAELYLAAVTAPTGVMNAITIASLKKLYLVSLLLNGEAPVLPKHTSAIVTRAVKAECTAYVELAKVVAAAATAAAGTKEGATTPSNDIVAFAMNKADVWRADGNVGLVRCVVDAIIQRKVQALTHTFCSLPTAGVAHRAALASPREAELALLRMIDAGQVHARLNEREGMVEFSDDADDFASAETAAKLEDLIKRCMALSSAVSAMDHSVSTDHAFLSKADIVRAGGGGGGVGGVSFGATPGPSGMPGGNPMMMMMGRGESSRDAFRRAGSFGEGAALPSPMGELLDEDRDAMM